MLRPDPASLHPGKTAVLPGGKLASGSADTTVRVWDLATGVCLLSLAHTSSVSSLAVLPDGKLASGSLDGMVRIWENDKCVLTLTGHTKAVKSFAVLPNGKLASGSSDNTVCIWC